MYFVSYRIECIFNFFFFFCSKLIFKNTLYCITMNILKCCTTSLHEMRCNTSTYLKQDLFFLWGECIGCLCKALSNGTVILHDLDLYSCQIFPFLMLDSVESLLLCIQITGLGLCTFVLKTDTQDRCRHPQLGPLSNAWVFETSLAAVCLPFSTGLVFLTLGVAILRCIPSCAALVMKDCRTLLPSPTQAMVSPFKPP